MQPFDINLSIFLYLHKLTDDFMFFTLLDSLQFTGLSKEIDSLLPTVSNSLPNWQTPFGYTLASDDDLGFDPFLESNKALADMLENESGQHISPLPSNFRSPMVRTAPPPGVPLPAHIPVTSAGLFSDGIMSAIVPPMLPVVTSSSSPLPPPPPGLSGLPQFPSSSASSNTQGKEVVGAQICHFIPNNVVEFDCHYEYDYNL